MEIPHHILKLIDKYLSSEITSDELHELNKWYHEFDRDESEVLYADPSLSQMEILDIEEQVAQQIHQRLMADINPPKKRPKKWRSYAAAITLLLMIGGLSLLLSKKPKVDPKMALNTPMTSAALQGDLAPGGNKARLMLSDGTVLILDSAHNGVIGRQGATRIQKLEGGLIAYNEVPNKGVTVLYNSISTPRGGTYCITLADGTKVWLNAATELRFPTAFPGNTREVNLTGEAYFEVAKNKSKPFIVHTKGQDVQVLGTHFNIKAYQDEAATQTTLLEGSVQILSKDNNETKLILKPGQQSSLSMTGKLLLNKDPDLEQAVGWKEGNFIFHSTDFNTILKEISRWYDADIINHSSKNPVFTGQISKQLPVSKVFALLSLTNEIHYRIQGNKITVTTK